MECFGQIRTPKILPAPTPMCCTTTDLGNFWNVLVVF